MQQEYLRKQREMASQSGTPSTPQHTRRTSKGVPARSSAEAAAAAAAARAQLQAQSASASAHR